MEHLSNRRGAIMGADQLDMQERAVAKAYRWQDVQAMRLGVTSQEVLDAIGRGWTAEDVENLSASEAARLGSPPSDPYMAAAIKRISSAPVKPFRAWERKGSFQARR